jgi:peptidoglycan/LPS O-acetylase OafA/YrhL
MKTTNNVEQKPDTVSTAAIAPHSDKAVLPNLDGIRGMACLLVVLSHMPLQGKFITLGETGVGIFFVLSGFLMSYLYGLAKWDCEAVCKYGIARFSRIAPIYWFVISLCIFISYLKPDDFFALKITGVTSVARHYLFGGNVLIFWSIPPEIQYYIFFIFVWWAVFNRFKFAFTLPLLVIVCAIFVLTHNLWPGLSLPRNLHFFIAGTLAGFIPRNVWSDKVAQKYLSVFQFGSVFIIVAPLWLYASKPEFYKATEIGMAFGVAIYFLSISSVWTNVIFASPMMRRIGQASFSIYLTHMIVFYYGVKIIGLNHDVYTSHWWILGLLGVALPMLVSKYIEMPLQKITRRFLEGWLMPIIKNQRNENGLFFEKSKTRIESI